MATLSTVYGANATLRAAVPPSMIASQENYGRVRHMYDSYSWGASDEFGTSGLVKMMKIPKGARLIDGVFACTDSGSTGTCEVGWAAGETGAEAADPDGIFTTQTLTSAITGTRMLSTVPGWQKTFAEEVEVQIDLTAATDGGAGGVMELSLLLVVD